jgi:hypothetical protein
MTEERSVTVGYHGHCFDGMCSAAAVTRLLRAVEPGPLRFRYQGLDHQPGGSHVPESALDGDLNVVVDFRYAASERLSWWFDHHVSGIVGDDERAHFEADTSGRKFFDPTYSSCCKLIADIARERFQVDFDAMAQTVRWADIIDAARFDDAKMAVELKEPALQLMSVIEAHGNDRFLVPRIEALADGAPLDDIASASEVRMLFEPLQREHEAMVDTVRTQAKLEGGVVFFDLAATGRERFNKFVPYYLFPESRYAVAVSAGHQRTKVSVGSNPWARVPRTHDIASLCAKYGGGGHPVVGAVSLAAGEIDRAREIANEIVAALRS